jgi:hypothetical protein
MEKLNDNFSGKILYQILNLNKLPGSQTFIVTV